MASRSIRETNTAYAPALSSAMSTPRAAALRRGWWKLLRRAAATRLGVPVRGAFAFLDPAGAWRGFAPSARSADAFTLRADSTGNFEGLVAAAAALLRTHGVVVILGLVSGEAADGARRDIDDLVRRLRAGQRDDAVPNGVLDGLRWQTDLGTDPDFFADERPIVNFRARKPGAIDGGMLNIYRMDQVAQSHGLQGLTAILRSPGYAAMRAIVEKLFGVAARHVQLFRNDSVTVTRALHTDTLGCFYNGFVYLNDVLGEGDGPYSYVPGSHRREDLLYKASFVNDVRRRRNKEFPELAGAAVPLLGPKGTMIISCQRGVHGGVPQRAGGSRTMLVANFV